ncbi:MAG: hypothetical protein IKN35_01840, partial [Lachnospiraceae bacterium]|nr:hypothetical protein [Lachnospiraceae bacterium]
PVMTASIRLHFVCNCYRNIPAARAVNILTAYTTATKDILYNKLRFDKDYLQVTKSLQDNCE